MRPPRFPRRLALVLLLGSGLVVAATTLWSLAAPPVESLELDAPSMSPAVITRDVATFVTFTASLPDETIKSPRLQFFDPAKGKTGKWRTIKSLSDNGKGEDPVKGDRIFNLRLSFLATGDNTAIALPPVKPSRPARVKGEAGTPVQLRLAARRKGKRGIVVSAPFSPDVWQRTSASSAGTVITFDAPTTWTLFDDSSPSETVGIELQSPSGSSFIVLPLGGFPYDIIGDEIVESQSNIAIGPYTATRRDFRIADALILARVELHDVPGKPNFRVELRPVTPTDRSALEVLLASLALEP